MLSSQRGIPEPPLSGVKPADTPLARLGNWSILSPRLSTFGIEIDPDTKSLIVVGGAWMAERRALQLFLRVSTTDISSEARHTLFTLRITCRMQTPTCSFI